MSIPGYDPPTQRGLVHLLLFSTPRPLVFFGWIISLTTVMGGWTGRSTR